MLQTEVKVEDGYYVIRIPVAQSYEDRMTREFLGHVKVGKILLGSQATEDQVSELAEELQSNWWKTNKERFLG